MINHNAPVVINLWLENARMVKAIGDQYDVKTFFLWQPVIHCGNKLLSNKEKDIIKKDKDSAAKRKVFNVVYNLANEQFAKPNIKKYPKIYNISNIFDNNQDTIYLDFAHVNGKGNQLIANRIFKIIMDN